MGWMPAKTTIGHSEIVAGVFPLPPGLEMEEGTGNAHILIFINVKYELSPPHNTGRASMHHRRTSTCISRVNGTHPYVFHV